MNICECIFSYGPTSAFRLGDAWIPPLHITFNLAFKGKVRNDIEEDCVPTTHEMNEMLSETDKKHILLGFMRADKYY